MTWIIIVKVKVQVFDTPQVLTVFKVESDAACNCNKFI